MNSLSALIDQILTLSEQVEEEMKENSDIKNLTYKQLYCIELIGRLDNPTISELSEALKITKPSTSVMVDKLEISGYVRKVKSDEDRRIAHVHLTDKGENAKSWHLDVHHNIANILTENLNKEEKENLIKLLVKAVKSVK